MVERWLEANRRAQDAGDWRPMADMYTEDATYGWNIGPHEEFMAVGRDEIRDIALGLRDGRAGRLDLSVPEGAHRPRPGRGHRPVEADRRRHATRRDAATRSPGSVAAGSATPGDWQWSWQRDFFDVGNATSLFIEMIKADALSEGMKRRIERAGAGELLPGHYRLGDSPAGLWD